MTLITNFQINKYFMVFRPIHIAIVLKVSIQDSPMASEFA